MKKIFFIALWFVACTTLVQAQTQSDSISAAISYPDPDAVVKVQGYRIQVYSGANTREAKMKAYNMGYYVENVYPELKVYTRFVNTRWLCRVGNFVTRKDAADKLNEMREIMGSRLDGATIVKCKVSVPVYMLEELNSANDSITSLH